MTNLQETLRGLSSQDLLSLGVSQVAYVKPVIQDGQSSFAIHGADGARLAVMASYEAALGVIRQHGMEPLPLN